MGVTAVGTIDLLQFLEAVVEGNEQYVARLIEPLRLPLREPRTNAELRFDGDDVSSRLLSVQLLATYYQWQGDIRMAAQIALALVDMFEALDWLELPAPPERAWPVANTMDVGARSMADGGGVRDLLARGERWAEWLDRAGMAVQWRGVQRARAEACFHAGRYENGAIILDEIRQRFPDFLDNPIERRLHDKLDDLLRAADRPDTPAADWRWIVDRSLEDHGVAEVLAVSENDTLDTIGKRIAVNLGVLIGNAPAELMDAIEKLPHAGSPLFVMYQVSETLGSALQNGTIALSAISALAARAHAVARDFGFWGEEINFGWIESVALRRQKRFEEALPVLRELRASVRSRQGGIEQPLLRAALSEVLPHLYGVSAEVLFDLGPASAPELFEVVEEAKGRILAALVAPGGGHRAEARLPRLVELLRSSPRPARYVTLFADQEHTYAVAVSPRGELRTARFGFGRTQISAAAQELSFLNDGEPGSFTREAGIDPDHPFETDYTPVLQTLAPMAEWLARVFAADPLATNEVICVAPDGPLYNMPLSCLEIAGKPLIEHTAITLVPSFEVLAASAAMRSSTMRERAYTVAVPRSTEFDSGLYDSAIYTRDAREIANRWATIELPLSECDPNRLIARDLNHVLLHIGAHGIFDPAQPLDGSGIVLTSGGVLPSGRGSSALQGLLNPRLAAQLRIRASHVTLRACVSGKTTEVTSREALGMIWALFQAGASSVVAAAWHADLRSASDLLSRFYAHLASEHCVPLALRKAALATRDVGGTWGHPYHYAAFNAFGYWD